MASTSRGDNVFAALLAREYTASAAIAIFSSVVNGRKGNTAVTRDRSEACNQPGIESFAERLFSNTYSEALRDMRSCKIHEFSVLFSSNGFTWVGSRITVFQHKVVAYIGRSEPDHASDVDMLLSSFKRATA